MKIAFIVNEFPSLSQTFVLNQITGLIDRGHAVDIFADYPGPTSKFHEDVKNYHLNERISYPIAIPKNKVRRLFQSFRFIFKLFRKNTWPIIHSLDIFKYGRKAASLTLLFQIIPFLEKGPYDIVHCHFGPCGNFGALLKDLKATKGKIITTFHGYDLSKYLHSSKNGVYEYLFGKGDLFLPISGNWQEKLIELGCNQEKIVVHRMGIDATKFAFNPRKPKFEDNVQLVTIARLVEKKGVEVGIQAVATVLKKFPNLEYKIIGDGPLKNQLERLIEDLKIGVSVQLLGWKEQDEVVEIMKSADILLAPSVTSHDGDQEGIPVVLMEALAQGLPVVSTYHSGIPELVQDENSGLLVRERDVNGLVDKLEYLLVHQEIWAEMGKKGRSQVEKNYEINKLNDQLVDLYRKLLNGECFEAVG